jgi:hypothetical protein
LLDGLVCDVAAGGFFSLPIEDKAAVVISAWIRSSSCGKTNRVGLIVEVPDMDTFQRMMESEAAADAMKFDGVRPETILMLVEPEPSI